MKRYLKKNVYDAAQERIAFIFSEFQNICVSFSGGKDSSVMLNLCLDHMRENGIRRKIGVLFIDLEGQYTATIDHIREMLDENSDLIQPFWVCLPINLRNAVSVYEPFWCCWEPGAEDKWVRKMPDHPAVISDQSFFPFYSYRMEFEEFVPAFGEWFADGKPAAMLVGIRTDESLNRFRTIASTAKKTYQNKAWTTQCGENVFNAYPIYDWGTEDLWIANARCGWKYNRLYDMFYRAGVGIHDMRICQPYGDDQRIGLDLFRVIEPQTWARVVNRVSGANFGNIYCGTKLLGFRQVDLPPGHTWKSYTKLLLASLPPETAANYRDRFAKFIRYWRKTGSPVMDQYRALLPDEAEITEDVATRGAKTRTLVRYRTIPDALDNKLESAKAAPTWRRMAACILKNDHLCKGLSFTQTTHQVERMKALIEKYRNI